MASPSGVRCAPATKTVCSRREQIEQLLEQWSMAPGVAEIQAVRAVAFINAFLATEDGEV
jgi:hypothetical protein